MSLGLPRIVGCFLFTRCLMSYLPCKISCASFDVVCFPSRHVTKAELNRGFFTLQTQNFKLFWMLINFDHSMKIVFRTKTNLVVITSVELTENMFKMISDHRQRQFYCFHIYGVDQTTSILKALLI